MPKCHPNLPALLMVLCSACSAEEMDRGGSAKSRPDESGGIQKGDAPERETDGRPGDDADGPERSRDGERVDTAEPPDAAEEADDPIDEAGTEVSEEDDSTATRQACRAAEDVVACLYDDFAMECEGDRLAEFWACMDRSGTTSEELCSEGACGLDAAAVCDAIDCVTSLLALEAWPTCAADLPELCDGSLVCEDTCDWSGDGVCDDGGEGASTDVCDHGTDCTDCGLREAPTAEECLRPGGEDDCTAHTDCCAGSICVRFDSGARCADSCETAADCASGCCVPLESGGSACAEERYCEAEEAPECLPAGSGEQCTTQSDCCDGSVCVAFDVGNYCSAPCDTGADCASDCCIPLESDAGACANERYCGEAPDTGAPDEAPACVPQYSVCHENGGDFDDFNSCCEGSCVYDEGGQWRCGRSGGADSGPYCPECWDWYAR
jgi:hypothetical protein